jgi:hypothetical protein
VRRNNSLSHMLLGAALTLGASQAMALKELDDSSLSEVQGAGLAFAMDDFSFRFAPTSYIELTGTQAQGAGWERGDARYYGLSITNGEQPAGMDWHGSGCGSGGAFGNDYLSCPMGTDSGGGIGAFASIYDPYVLRAYQYEGYDYSGAYLSTPENMPTVMELIGPSDTDRWRWAFWGELEVDRLNNNPADGALNNSYNGGGADFLQSQTIIHGKPVTTDGRPARLRLMRTTGMDSTLYPWADSNTFGITYESAISGDFRFSVRQKAGSEDRLHWVPDFEDNEGMYFKNVDAYLPLGQLHYQALTLDAVRTGSERGNFVIELTRIPSIAAVYEDFYCTGPCEIDNGEILNPNDDTRGYVRWGDFTRFDNPSSTEGFAVPGPQSVDNGIYFVSGGSGTGTVTPDTVTNLGISRIEGMRINHMKITTLGAGL